MYYSIPPFFPYKPTLVSIKCSSVSELCNPSPIHTSTEPNLDNSSSSVICASQSRKERDDSISIVKGKPMADIPRMIVAERKQKRMKRNVANCSDRFIYETDYNKTKQESRATSPLDTMAEVACRLSMELPLIAQRGSKKSDLPANAFVPVSVFGCQEQSSSSPKSIPTQETISPIQPSVIDPVKDSGHEPSISLQSLLRTLRRYNLESGTDVSCLGSKIAKIGMLDGMKSRKIAEHFSEEISLFKDGVMTALENVVLEISKVKEEVVSLQKSLEIMQQRNAGDKVVMVRPEEVGKVWFIVRPVTGCEEAHDAEDDKSYSFHGNNVAIHVERKMAGKRERGLDHCLSSGSEVAVRGSKPTSRIAIREGLRSRTERGESITESASNSGKSDCDYTESGNKKSRNEGMVGKLLKSKGTKRRRDNWTEEENTVFMEMVLENQEVEEMTLRRMLARRFSPRRTHEQCANHLRILRAQKKLPSARQDVMTSVKKDE